MLILILQFIMDISIKINLRTEIVGNCLVGPYLPPAILTVAVYRTLFQAHYTKITFR
jgi:hypothetical protein